MVFTSCQGHPFSPERLLKSGFGGAASSTERETTTGRDSGMLLANAVHCARKRGGSFVKFVNAGT
jgi:hypothetical protein